VAQDDDFYETPCFLACILWIYIFFALLFPLMGERERDKIKDLKGTTQEMVV
jgi:hypothetical protein